MQLIVSMICISQTEARSSEDSDDDVPEDLKRDFIDETGTGDVNNAKK